MRKQQKEAASELKRLSKFFAEEMASRAWGQDEFEKLLAECHKAGEAVDDEEREATRHVLAAVDRVMSIRVASECAVEIIRERPGTRSIPPQLFRDVLAAVKGQAAHSINDAFAACRSCHPPVNRRKTYARPVPLRQAAADLANLRLHASDLKAYRTLAESRPAPKPTAFAAALTDALYAARFLENAIRQTDRLVADAAKKTSRIQRAPLADLMTFVANSASFVQDVVTEQINEGVRADDA